jgi:hypothetical protein
VGGGRVARPPDDREVGCRFAGIVPQGPAGSARRSQAPAPARSGPQPRPRNSAPASRSAGAAEAGQAASQAEQGLALLERVPGRPPARRRLLVARRRALGVAVGLGQPGGGGQQAATVGLGHRRAGREPVEQGLGERELAGGRADPHEVGEAAGAAPGGPAAGDPVELLDPADGGGLVVAGLLDRRGDRERRQVVHVRRVRHRQAPLDQLVGGLGPRPGCPARTWRSVAWVQSTGGAGPGPPGPAPRSGQGRPGRSVSRRCRRSSPRSAARRRGRRSGCSSRCRSGRCWPAWRASRRG